MESLDERVTYLERRMEVHTALAADLRTDLRALRAEIGQLRSDMRADLGELRSEVRADLGALRSEMRADVGELSSDLRRTDQKMDRHFTWLVGVLVGVLLALIGLAFQVAQLQPL